MKDLEVSSHLAPWMYCHWLSLCLQSRLSRNLSNFRAIDGLLSEAFSGLQVRTPLLPLSPMLTPSEQRNAKRADRAMNHQVPNIHSDLQESKEVLEDLSETLPIIQTQVHEINNMYESGRRKVRFVDSRYPSHTHRCYRRLKPS